MTKNVVFVAALLSLALLMSCSSAHSPNRSPQVSVTGPNGLSVLYVGQSVQFTATVQFSSDTSVNWSITNTDGSACTDPNTCGTLSGATSSTVTYNAPNQPESVNLVATLQSDSGVSGSLTLSTVNISVQVTPYNADIGVGLTEQYTAVVIPDDAPQGITWSLTNCSGSCGSINANTGLYSASGASAGSTFSVQATVNAPLSGSGSVPGNVVTSRLTPNGTYAFHFSGFDVNTKLATASSGIFTVSGTGKSITGGTWDELTSGGAQPCTFSSGTFTSNSNNQGTLSLSGLCNGSPRTPTYNVVFDAAGDIQMIDSNGTGSGVIEPVTGSFKNVGALKGNFVFGFTGVDPSTRARTGYVGLLPMDGAGNIGGGGVRGLMDINNGGSAHSASDITGTYTLASSDIYSVTITSASLGTLHFDLYGVSGQLSATSPATLYAISTDSKPGVTGTVVFQDPKLDTSNGGLNNTSVVDLSGVNSSGGSNVALSLLNPDKKGNIGGSFDQNNAGTVQSVTSFTNTYNQSGSGRYGINLLGDSGKSLPFVLYLYVANGGFLLDQSSSSVMTGHMAPQLPKAHTYSASELPSTFALGTTDDADKSVDPLVGNALITWVNTGSCTNQCVNGTIYDANHSGGLAIAGSYILGSNGAGGLGKGGSSIVLTTPSNQNFVLYMLDVFDYTNPTKDTTRFLMFEEDSGVNNASIIKAQQ